MMDTIELISEIRVLKERLENSVEVVRCRECRYFNGENKFCDYSIQVKGDDYCSYGERKHA